MTHHFRLSRLHECSASKPDYACLPFQHRGHSISLSGDDCISVALIPVFLEVVPGGAPGSLTMEDAAGDAAEGSPKAAVESVCSGTAVMEVGQEL